MKNITKRFLKDLNAVPTLFERKAFMKKHNIPNGSYDISCILHDFIVPYAYDECFSKESQEYVYNTLNKIAYAWLKEKNYILYRPDLVQEKRFNEAMAKGDVKYAQAIKEYAFKWALYDHFNDIKYWKDVFQKGERL